MKEQSEPISADEYILRRIPNIKNYIDLTLPIPVQRGALGPSSNDDDGLSVYREEFISAEDLANAGTNMSGYFVVRFRAQDLISLGLNLIPDPLPPLPGHSLIPELSRGSKKANRNFYKEVTLELAKLASQDIVYFPNS
ncbi:MAG: hypothetical protein OQK73_03025 [Gammaproteobacteria bacterium]|nr:hypothetical protein [Gammaproteobacteria bacterium]